MSGKEGSDLWQITVFLLPWNFPGKPLWVKQIELNPGRSRQQLWFTAQGTREERAVESPEDLQCGLPQTLSRVAVSTGIWGSYWKWGNHLKGLEGTVPSTPTALQPGRLEKFSYRQEINPHICDQLTYNKGAKNIQ